MNNLKKIALEIKKQAGLFSFVPEKILDYIIKNPKSVMVDNNKGDYYRAVEFWTGTLNKLIKLDVRIEKCFGSILKLFKNDLKSKNNKIADQLNVEGFPESDIKIKSDDTITDFILNYHDTKDIIEVLLDKHKSYLDNKIQELSNNLPDNKNLQKMKNQLQIANIKTQEVINLAKDNQDNFISSDYQKKIAQAAQEVIKEIDDFKEIDPWHKSAGLKDAIISIFNWVKSFFTKIDILEKLVT